jgi:hypothetical protein
MRQSMAEAKRILVTLVLLAGASTLTEAQQPGRPVLLDIASHLSAERVKAGDSFTVVLDLAPAQRMHVYAPTVVDYKPIAFTIKPQPGLIVHNATYPPAEKYFYAPLKQTIDVYQKPFRITQELALDGSAAGRAALKGISALTVQGALTYQACDDKICYPPRTVPLTWTVGIKEL